MKTEVVKISLFALKAFMAWVRPTRAKSENRPGSDRRTNSPAARGNAKRNDQAETKHTPKDDLNEFSDEAECAFRAIGGILTS